MTAPLSSSAMASVLLGRSVSPRPLPPTPRRDAAQLLLLARLDPATDLAVAADVLADALVACGGRPVETGARPGTVYGWEVEQHHDVVDVAYYGGPAEPVWSCQLRGVAVVLAVADRVLACEDDVETWVVEDAVSYAVAVAKEVR